MRRLVATIALLLVLMTAGTPAFAQMSCMVHYTCTSSQCASVIGGYNVTKGPFAFASESACLSQARQQMTSARCSCSAGSAPAGAQASGANQSPEQAAADAMNRVIRSGNFATANNATMTMGAGIATGVAVLVLRSALQGPSPQELARREAVRQEQLRLQAEAEERARIEAEQRHRRIVAGLQGATLSADSAPRLAGASDVRIDSPTATAGNLALLKTDAAPPPAVFAQSGARWTAGPAAPPPSGGNLALLKRGDDSPEAASEAARRPFDTAGSLALAPASVPPAAVAVPAGAVAAPAPAASAPAGSATGGDDSAIMANRKPRPDIRISGGVDIPGPVYRPGQVGGNAATTAAVAPVALAAPQPVAPAQGAGNPVALSAAYNRGYKEAQSCVSQNAGNACQDSGSGQAHLACVSSYQQGYAAGAGFRDSLIQGTENAGRLDKAAGRDKGATPISPQLDAGCSIEATQAYNRGYGL